MFALVIRFRAKEGKAKDVERLFHDMIEKVRANEKETLNYDLHRNPANACEFMLYERYTDRRALEVTHCSTPYFKELSAILPEYLDGGLDRTDYELIEEK